MRIFTLIILLTAFRVQSQDIKEYYLTINDTIVTISGKSTPAIAVNGQIPAPTLYFTEGDSAVIHVKNLMEEETSVHWHGLLLPNFMDGVPYLTTPPIRTGETFTYRFKIRQTGTYWYHSHTMLQEQKGQYGAIVIHPINRDEAVRDLVLVLSDWTDRNPMGILRSLKRGTEWYIIQKGNAQSLNRILSNDNLGAKLKLSAQRMPGMDISDVYYEAFLSNGEKQITFSDIAPGTTVRLRVINAAASTYFHLHYAGGKMMLAAADGIEVMPIMVDRVLIGVAETYDFLFTVPEGHSYEFRASAQDGSGYTSAFIGAGHQMMAADIPPPDIFAMNETMAMMDHRMGEMGNMEEMPPGHMQGHDHEMGTPEEEMHHQGHEMPMPDTTKNMDHQHHEMDMDMPMEDEAPGMDMTQPGDQQLVILDYDMLRSTEPTVFSEEKNIKHLQFNLTGNMWRYVWSINGKVLSKADKIKVDSGEVLRITMTNNTMMHHPMHLHGHFFRVINQQGNYSPLKHTVDVPPMQTVTIEFLADEVGDWFFHCHVLYHMMSGMARVFSYNIYERPAALDDYPLKFLLVETNPFWFLGEATIASHRQEVELSYFNTHNQLMLEGEIGGWYAQKGYEAELTYARWFGDYFRIYAGGRFEAAMEGKVTSETQFTEFGAGENSAVIGMRYLLPFFINADLSINHKLEPRLGISGTLWLFPKTEFFYAVESAFADELFSWEYNLGLEQMISRDFSIVADYHNHYGVGAGVEVRF